jgi:endonuclease/exonuclease/phosphatase family metal-dependent hydrolase
VSKLRIVTLNLLQDDWLRHERIELAIAEIKRLKPDVLMLQEVDISGGVHKIFKQNLPGYHVSTCRRSGIDADYGLAVFTRTKPLGNKRLALSQNRVAQKVTLILSGKRINIVNVHLYFSPFKDRRRQEQVALLLHFAGDSGIITGDFNALPRARSVKMMEPAFYSAHKKVHGREPARTYPSPLWRGKGTRHSLRRTGIRLWKLLTFRAKTDWAGTIDYIFIRKGLKVKKCEVVFNRPAKTDKKLYASDHYGLLAELEF